MAAETVDEAVFEILTGAAGIAAIVRTKVHLGYIPQTDLYPAIWFRQVSIRDPFESFNSTGLTAEESTFEFTCEGSDQMTSARLAKALKAALNGYSGTVGNIRIDNAVRVGQRGNPDAVNQRYSVTAFYAFTAAYL